MLTAARVAAVADELEARSPGIVRDARLCIGSEDLDEALHDAMIVPVGSRPEDLRGRVEDMLATRGVAVTPGGTSDPLSHEVLRGVRDAWRDDLLHAVGAAPEASTTQELLASHYTWMEAAAEGTRCFVRDRPGRPLLLLNALGLPLTIWSQLLGGDHGYRIIVPELPVCALIDGGMTATMSALEVAPHLRELLSGLDLPDIDVLAWCNGGRIAVELLRIAPDLLGRVVLLSPTFRGGATPSGRTSEFEDHLDSMFVLAGAGPARAGRVSAVLRRPQPDPDWQALADQPEQRAARLLGMPRREIQDDIKVPMANADSLLHYIARTRLDESVSAQVPSDLPGDRITLVCGSHDTVVDNVHTVEWLEAHAPGFTHLRMSGAGHYIQDLQYRYLLHVLDRVLLARGGREPLPVRLSLESGG